jgi:hypothetical protein
MLGKFVQLRMQGVRDPFKSMANGGGGGKGDEPDTPDYSALAREQSQMQRDINRETLAANRVNQVTPYGNLNYTQSGTDQYGNPTYTATQVLSPEQQKLLNQNTALSSDMLTGAQSGLANYTNVMANPTVDQSQLAQTGINPGEVYSDAIMRRLQPQIAQETASFENKLANQGIAPGSEAYMNARRSFDQAQNDKMTSAIVGGMNTGLQANQQGFNQAAYNLTSPMNIINSLRTGNQVQNPSYVNPVQQQNYSAPDLMGAGQAGFNSAMGSYNAGQQANANFMGGLMGLGGAIGGASPGTLFGGIGSKVGGFLGL